MSTLNPTLDLTRPRHGAGDLPPVPPGGGDGDRGPAGVPGYHERLHRYRLGVAIFLISVLMVFVALTSAYVVRQGLGSWDDHTASYVLDWRPLALPTTLLVINTLVLVASSLTLEMARRSLSRYAVTAGLARIPGVAVDAERSLPWLGITLVLGSAFLAGQVTAWWELRRAGVFIDTNPSASFFYLLTGAHGLHLFGGLLALTYAAGTSLLRKTLETRRIVVEAAGLYWHFMGLLWLYIFALLRFTRG